MGMAEHSVFTKGAVPGVSCVHRKWRRAISSFPRAGSPSIVESSGIRLADDSNEIHTLLEKPRFLRDASPKNRPVHNFAPQSLTGLLDANSLSNNSCREVIRPFVQSTRPV